MNINQFGTLYVVATPIGNLEDMSFRSIAVLKNVAWIAAEDTRHSSSLLKHFAIATPIFSLHEHNERQRTSMLLDKLKKGESIALISDAGTPLINDPGFFLVREARNQGIKVEPIPGPCAAIVALSASGLPTDKFVFEGFLSAKAQARLAYLKTLALETRTMIFYEAPHRILDTLGAMQAVFGENRNAVLARELTKLYETIHNGTLADLISWVQKDPNQQKGEIVLIVEGAIATPRTDNAALLTILLENLPLKQAVEVAAQITGERKNKLYEESLLIQKRSKEQ